MPTVPISYAYARWARECTYLLHSGYWDLQIFKKLFEERGWSEASRLRDEPVLLNQCSILLRKCVCQLHTVSVCLASAGFVPSLQPMEPVGGIPPPDFLCPPYSPKRWLLSHEKVEFSKTVVGSIPSLEKTVG